MSDSKNGESGEMTVAGVVRQLALGGVLGPASYVLAKYVLAPGTASKQDGQNVQDIIAAGRANGVDEMKIQVSRKARVGATLETAESLGLNLAGKFGGVGAQGGAGNSEGTSVVIGTKGETVYDIHVRYKKD